MNNNMMMNNNMIMMNNNMLINNMNINANNNQINNNNENSNILKLEGNEKLGISFKDIYNINEVTNMKDLLSCPICLNLLIFPVQCNKCNKCFCKECINKYENSKNRCPFRCINPKYNENKFMKNVLSILKFKCKNGCKEIIPYDSLEKHYEEDCDKIDFKKNIKIY